MLGSSRGLESGSTKRGEIHHIASDHGPMVQGGLLTAHPGGVPGYGWSPGEGSSFRQGAGAASPGGDHNSGKGSSFRQGAGAASPGGDHNSGEGSSFRQGAGAAYPGEEPATGHNSGQPAPTP